MKKVKLSTKTISLISIIILLISLIIVYIILIPKNSIKVYSNVVNQNTLVTIQNVIQAQNKFKFTKANFIGLLEKSDQGLKPSLIEINPEITKDQLANVVEETLFLEYLVEKSSKKANYYIQARLDNLETEDWKNLVIYAKAERELKQFQTEKSKIITDKENTDITGGIIKDFGMSQDNNIVVTINNKFLANTISSPYRLNLAITKYNLDDDKRRLPLMSDKNYQGVYPAYSNKDCSDKPKAYGTLKGVSTKEFNCEYQESQELEVQVLVKEGQKDNSSNQNQIRALESFINSNLKNIKVKEEENFNQDLADKLELTEDKNVILELSTAIESTPVYKNLLDNGIIKKVDNKYYLVP